ncbi:DeoR/GlpR family DNA-binding transcription regulator [Pseudarthrobacter raffinosi]|uniref:DeoR/GlpR family DNA-binding transcription regulator n=1 Tax=Pseudarthrobacter raffinosi TaxID=2953651 RepID=UPI00208EDA44|nr:DeoR/GlpR family DNA-binding transcription regulator [Pseudarthrobacter sp. MDT3-9]MCO4253237.1 DeoR/GlpR family DNA-binding transcription regulator [Pseudarthrobacter sp. MDT3-9]
MNVTERHGHILGQLQRDGRVVVAELAGELGISGVTIRRDLEELAETGVLRRVRGGAVSVLTRGEGLPFAMREMDSAEVKDHMAVAVAALIKDGEAVAVDSGTTGAAVARRLHHRRLTVAPFSIQALAQLAGSTSVNLVLPGGSVRVAEGSFIGPLAEASLQSLRFDTAILTCCGASLEDGIMAHDLQDAAVKRAMIAAARRVVLVAEGAKFSRSAMAVVCPLSSIDVLVTDDSSPHELRQRLHHDGVEVIVV